MFGDDVAYALDAKKFTIIIFRFGESIGIEQD